MKKIVHLFLMLTVSLLLLGANSNPDKQNRSIGLKKLKSAEYDKNKWTEYIPGNMPLVISVPHGGNLIVDSIPFSTCKGHNSHYDYGTIEIARAIQKEYEEKYQLRPHIVICHLSRKHIDQNRDIEKGTCGNAYMKESWNNFHNYIDQALREAVKNHKRAVYIDLHGHPHTKQKVELGYKLNKEDLIALKDKTVLNDMEQKSSFQNFFSGKWKKEISIINLLTGENSFGTLLANNGIPTVPSAQDKEPQIKDPYFAAETVYNTPTYTSAKYPNVIGWQVECGTEMRKEGHAKMAKAFAIAMNVFIQKNTDIKFPLKN